MAMQITSDRDTRAFRREIEGAIGTAEAALRKLAEQAETEMDAMLERIKELEAENAELRERVEELEAES